MKTQLSVLASRLPYLLLLPLLALLLFDNCGGGVREVLSSTSDVYHS